MARQISLLDTVNAAQGDQAEPKKAAPAPRKRAQSPRKTSTAKSTSSKPKAAQKPAPKATKPAPAPEAGEPQELPRREQPHIRGVRTGDAVRLNLYIHPDDAEWLKYELRGGTTQNVFRAFIAIARHNQRLAEQVAKLSLNGPRGEH